MGEWFAEQVTKSKRHINVIEIVQNTRTLLSLGIPLILYAKPINATLISDLINHLKSDENSIQLEA